MDRYAECIGERESPVFAERFDQRTVVIYR